MNAKKARALELLGAELEAIESWDAEYWRKSKPERFEKIAFFLRQKRRSEIVHQMAVLTRKPHRSCIGSY